MASPGPSPPSLLERVGLRALLTRANQSAAAGAAPAAPVAEVRILDPAELKQLRRIHWRAVTAAGLAGALSAAGSYLLTGYVQQGLPWLWHWGLLIVGNGLLAGIEIGFLYWDALRAVRAMAAAAGLKLNQSTSSDVALALARAALELPSPPHNPLEVDPMREASRLWMLVASLLYKGKVLLTSFLLKVLLRRALGRVATRLALELVSIPVTALWNVIVAHRVLQEARIRAMGPDTARALAAWCAADQPYTEGSSRLSAHAVGTQLVMARGVHPNILHLLDRLPRAPTPRDYGHTEDFLAELGAAAPLEREQALRALLAAGVLNGHPRRRERQWLVRCAAAVESPAAGDVAETIRQRFLRGEPLALPSEWLTKRPAS